MADSASEVEMESDTSSVDGGGSFGLVNPKQTKESDVKRIESLSQENRVLRMEIDTLKLKNRSLQAQNKELRQNSVNIQARAEQEEEYISNTLLKKINSLKREKEMLAVNYEHEEEFLTNDLTRKLNQLRSEKVELEQTLEQEQEAQVNKLLKRIDKLESEIVSKQSTLEQLRREKVELENSLEQEQEALVNKLWKRMDKLEVEKRMLQERLDQPVSAPPSPRTGERDVTQLTQNIMNLRQEVARYRHTLAATKQENSKKMAALLEEERQIKAENLRLHRKLQMETERREALCRHLSESESSLEMDDERQFNEIAKSSDGSSKDNSSVRTRTVSSPIPYHSNITPTKPLTVVTVAASPPNPIRCTSCGHIYHHSGATSVGMSTSLPSMSPPASSLHPSPHSSSSSSQASSSHSVNQRPSDKFAKPPLPTTRS
ncbi:coiled-coil domain-containing protein 6-like isoform X1 [Watersipora subatra]|uniref:coiled-coil domain-containing protein 6-like isoform X1 n=1 Tax=Watersipora subatra TaxID=2589382 RepID=UPI00355C976B